MKSRFSCGDVLARLALTLAVVVPATTALAITPSIPKGDIVVELELVCDGLTAPVFATHAGDKTGRLFIVDQAGVIRILDVPQGVCLLPP